MTPDERAEAIAAAVASSDASLSQIGVLGRLAGAALDVADLVEQFETSDTLAPLVERLAGWDHETLVVTLCAAVTLVHAQRRGLM